jgi:hypothetical protein
VHGRVAPHVVERLEVEAGVGDHEAAGVADERGEGEGRELCMEGLCGGAAEVPSVKAQARLELLHEGLWGTRVGCGGRVRGVGGGGGGGGRVYVRQAEGPALPQEASPERC